MEALIEAASIRKALIREASTKTTDRVAFDQSSFDQGALVRTMDKVAFDQSGSDQGVLGVHLHIRKIEKIRLRPDFFWSQTSKYVIFNVLLFRGMRDLGLAEQEYRFTFLRHA